MGATDAMTNVELSKAEYERYSRHLILPEVALDGQKKLKAASVLMIEVGSGPPDVLAKMKTGDIPAYPHNPDFYMEPDAVLYGARALSAVLLDLLQDEQRLLPSPAD